LVGSVTIRKPESVTTKRLRPREKEKAGEGIEKDATPRKLIQRFQEGEKSLDRKKKWKRNPLGLKGGKVIQKSRKVIISNENRKEIMSKQLFGPKRGRLSEEVGQGKRTWKNWGEKEKETEKKHNLLYSKKSRWKGLRRGRRGRASARWAEYGTR